MNTLYISSWNSNSNVFNLLSASNRVIPFVRYVHNSESGTMMRCISINWDTFLWHIFIDVWRFCYIWFSIWTNTMLCRYNAVNFHQNCHKRYPAARPWGRYMGCISEYNICMFCLSHCSTISKIMLCWTSKLSLLVLSVVYMYWKT